MFLNPVGTWFVANVDPNLSYFKLINTALVTFHLLLANIIMINYLIAALTTIYEDSLKIGDFAYKSNKYMYIERFYIPM